MSEEKLVVYLATWQIKLFWEEKEKAYKDNPTPENKKALDDFNMTLWMSYPWVKKP